MKKSMKNLQVFYIAAAFLPLLGCEKELPVKDATNSPIEQNDNSVGIGSQKASTELFVAMNYNTLPAMLYLIEQRNPTTGAVINANHATYFTGSSWSSGAVAGTIADDGTNFYGTNYDGKTYYNSSAGGTSYPYSTTGMTYLGTTFVADEIEYVGGNLYAITKAGGALLKINNPSTTTPSVTSVGPFFGSAKYDFNRKTIYRNPAANTLHLIHGFIGTTNSVKLYNVNTSTGVATLTNTITSIPFSTTSNFSAYHDGTDTYLMVQAAPSGLYAYSSYVLYKITAAGVVTTVTSGSYYLTGDFTYMQ